MKLLVLTTTLFGEPSGGGELCTSRLLSGLREAGHRIGLVGHGDAAAAARWADEVHSLGPTEPPFSAQPLAQRLWAVAGALASGSAITVQRQRQYAARRLVRAQLAAAGTGYDACVVDHLQAWPWLGHRPVLPAMLLNHNVESDNYRRLSRAANRGFQGNPRTRLVERTLMRREADRLRRIERQALHEAAVVACLSEGDAQRMAALAQEGIPAQRAHLLVLPGYPAARPAATAHMPGGRPAAGALRRVGLIGNWTWAPNRAGLQWLLAAVWPLLRHQGCQLVLAGGGLEGLDLPEGVLLLGRVPDVETFYSQVDLVAIPSLHGSGVQEKAIEAIGRGLPVVATAHALRGLAPGLPAQVHRADDPQAFARLCAEAPLPDASTEAAAHWATQRRVAYDAALAQALSLLHRPASMAPRRNRLAMERI
jgi:hypothetical protein